MTIRDSWEVKDAWQMEQTITFRGDGDTYFWYTNELIYSSKKYFSAVLGRNGDEINRFSFESDWSNSSPFVIAEKEIWISDSEKRTMRQSL